MALSIPSEISKTTAEEITIRWDDGHVSVFPIQYLRAECSCPICGNQRINQGRIDPTAFSQHLTITGAAHEGHYGVRFFFSDGHDKGIYTWLQLRQLCPCAICCAISE
ncbi:MAG: DUF971 domain-containing protein [Acidobacteriota bacterium]